MNFSDSLNIPFQASALIAMLLVSLPNDMIMLFVNYVCLMPLLLKISLKEYIGK